MNTAALKKDPRLISYQSLRKAVGWLGLSLPAALIIGNYIFNDCMVIEETISHYYFTITGNLLVGILCANALFLIVYKGYDKKDHILTNLAGIFALGVAFFPTNGSDDTGCPVFHLDDNNLRSTIHYVSAGLFFILLGYISLFQFTKSKGEITAEKIKRNKVFKICGITIFSSVALVAVYGFLLEDNLSIKYLKPKFWLETIALFAFGTSWLVKGEFILKDK